MTRTITAAFILAMLVMPVTGQAEPAKPDRCTRENGTTVCRSMMKPPHKVSEASRRLHHHRAKSIDPIITCSTGKDKPCVPVKPKP
ncbi:hypothetical protein NAC44_14825 [Allorhizobium sp. BGMRC 0089]|uniref:hypothetical protein n=1 Tax=Allorhizobium sonneratiae TaxID=2934936 RepID=UPI0020345908|nr:hypothetical protein [Allorhizobium sonneratiae]MCM2293600.1 hypothetical protein [Allorhizobium sonneratiae]